MIEITSRWQVAFITAIVLALAFSAVLVFSATSATAVPCALDGKDCTKSKACAFNCSQCQTKDVCCCKHVDTCKCVDPTTGIMCCDEER